MRYRRDGKNVSAVKWDGVLNEQVLQVIDKDLPVTIQIPPRSNKYKLKDNDPETMYVMTSEGMHVVNKGDYITSDDAGNLLPMPEQLFNELYEVDNG